MVAAVLLVLGLGIGRRFETVRAKVSVQVGRDAVETASHLTVATEVEVGQRGGLGAGTRVEDSLLVMKSDGHRGSGSLGTFLWLENLTPHVAALQ